MKLCKLISINSKFNHVNLAVRSLESWVKKYNTGYNVDFSLVVQNFTINQNLLDVLDSICCNNPQMVLFSVYIWNVEFIAKIIAEIKKNLPDSIVGCGGPEVSFCPDLFLKNNPNVDFIMAGEGEETLCQLLENNFEYQKVPGIYYFENELKFTGSRDLICDLDKLVFPYDDGSGNLVNDLHPSNNIFYYESSRGCPFSCSYCLSSLDKRVRFKSVEVVKREIEFFLRNKVHLVKFVDRTYNLREDRYIQIWNYIKENWNGVSQFHFEIEAGQLTQKALDAIKDVPPGMMQFEIGLQTTNPPTLNEIHRKEDLDYVHYVLLNIPKSIHVHLDLIAGLPFESLVEFKMSFNWAIGQRPSMLQLGFLKILHGTQMEKFAENYNQYKYLSTPPYEVFSSPWLSAGDIRFLKHVDLLVDTYYNSQNFLRTLEYIFDLYAKCNKTEWDFFEDLELFFNSKNYFSDAHSLEFWFEKLFDFITSENSICVHGQEFLKFDYICRGKTSSYPSWYKRNYSKDIHAKAIDLYYNKSEKSSSLEVYKNTALEIFDYNVIDWKEKSELEREKTQVLFIYRNGNPKSASIKTQIKSNNCVCVKCEVLE